MLTMSIIEDLMMTGWCTTTICRNLFFWLSFICSFYEYILAFFTWVYYLAVCLCCNSFTFNTMFHSCCLYPSGWLQTLASFSPSEMTKYLQYIFAKEISRYQFVLSHTMSLHTHNMHNITMEHLKGDVFYVTNKNCLVTMFWILWTITCFQACH